MYLDGANLNAQVCSFYLTCQVALVLSEVIVAAISCSYLTFAR